jgi:hypothetical protein
VAVSLVVDLTAWLSLLKSSFEFYTQEHLPYGGFYFHIPSGPFCTLPDSTCPLVFFHPQCLLKNGRPPPYYTQMKMKVTNMRAQKRIKFTEE